MIYHLGQLVINKWQALNTPAVVTGIDNLGRPELTFYNNGRLVENDWTVISSISPLRIEDPKSPTGCSIHMGPLCKPNAPHKSIRLKADKDLIIKTIKEAPSHSKVI